MFSFNPNSNSTIVKGKGEFVINYFRKQALITSPFIKSLVMNKNWTRKCLNYRH